MLIIAIFTSLWPRRRFMITETPDQLFDRVREVARRLQPHVRLPTHSLRRHRCGFWACSQWFIVQCYDLLWTQTQ